MSALAWLGVAVLGGCGAVARVMLDGVAARHLTKLLTGPGPRLAAGTFAVNVSGAFLLGLVDGIALTGDADILVGTATIGAYTTFSTWMLQTQSLRADGLRRAAIVNVVASVLAGFIAVLLGRAVGTLV